MPGTARERLHRRRFYTITLGRAGKMDIFIRGLGGYWIRRSMVVMYWEAIWALDFSMRMLPPVMM